MKNWSVDETLMKKNNPQAYQTWKLEQQLTYGLDEGEKINRQDVIKNWTILRDRLNPGRRELVKFLLWK